MARSSSRPSKTYKSKVDVLVLAIMLGAIVSLLGIVIGTWISTGGLRALQATFILAGVTGFMSWILLGTHYTLDGRDLVVRSGPFSWRIALGEIRSIERAAGLRRSRGSPALSMDRLLITYGADKSLMISPDERERFLADIKARQ